MPVPLASVVGVAVGAVASLVATALLVAVLLRRKPEAFLRLVKLTDADADVAEPGELPDE